MTDAQLVAAAINRLSDSLIYFANAQMGLFEEEETENEEGENDE